MTAFVTSTFEPSTRRVLKFTGHVNWDQSRLLRQGQAARPCSARTEWAPCLWRSLPEGRARRRASAAPAGPSGPRAPANIPARIPVSPDGHPPLIYRRRPPQDIQTRPLARSPGQQHLLVGMFELRNIHGPSPRPLIEFSAFLTLVVG